MYINQNRGQVPTHGCIYHQRIDRQMDPYMPLGGLPGSFPPSESSAISPLAQMLLLAGPGSLMGSMLDPNQQVPMPAGSPQFGSAPAAPQADPAARGDMSSLGPSTYDGIIQEAAARYNLDPALIKAVIKKESSFNPNAGSPRGARGLMQLMPATFREMGGRNALNPRDNIMAGARYLSQMLRANNGDVSLALAAYNAGPGNVRKYGGIPPFRETRNYVSVITADYQASMQSGMPRTYSV